MMPALKDYVDIVSNPVARQIDDGICVADRRGNFSVEKPVSPPSPWVYFKAALADLPGLAVLGRMVALNHARAVVRRYAVDAKKQQLSSKCFRDVFIQDIQAAYGKKIADMCARTCLVDGRKPLHARTVSQAIQLADDVKWNNCFANREAVKAFLARPHLQSIFQPWLKDAQGLSPEIAKRLNRQHPSWRDVVDDAGVKFIGDYVVNQCRHLPEYTQGRLGDEQIIEVAREAFRLYRDNIGRTQEAMSIKSGELDAYSALDHLLPASLLVRTAADVAMRNGHLEIPSAVLALVACDVRRSFPEWMQDGIGANVVPLTGMKEHLLKLHIEKVLTAHCAALREVEQSTVFQPDQKKMLEELARTRRFDRGQIVAYESSARAMSNAARDIADDLRGSHVDAAVDTLTRLLTRVGTMEKVMDQLGATLYHARPASHGVALEREFCRLAAAGMTPDEARSLLEVLVGESSHALAEGLLRGGDLEVSPHLVPLYQRLVEAIACRSGLSENAAMSAVSAPFVHAVAVAPGAQT